MAQICYVRFLNMGQFCYEKDSVYLDKLVSINLNSLGMSLALVL